MNGGVRQSSPVEQMVAGNPNWWSVSTQPPPNSLSSSWIDGKDQLPADSSSWIQLLSVGLVGENESQKRGLSNLQTRKELENWEEQLLVQTGLTGHDVKPEENSTRMYDEEEYEEAPRFTWTSPLINHNPVSPPTSCVTNLMNPKNLSDFAANKSEVRRSPPDRSSECNSTGARGGLSKKARVQPSSTQSPFKVRKEKLGERITALHQLVSPFGKTDTASVLLEAIGYIRFLQSQIQALSLPYLANNSGYHVRQQQHLLQTVRKESYEEPQKDLRSGGLCLVPISCTLEFGNNTGDDYWAPALDGGFR